MNILVYLCTICVAAFVSPRAVAGVLETLTIPSVEDWKQVVFASSRVGYLASATKLARTSDGGRSWTVRDVPKCSFAPTATKAEIVPIDEHRAWLWTCSALYETTDGGGSWSKVGTPFDTPPGARYGLQETGHLRSVRWDDNTRTILISGGLFRHDSKMADAPNYATRGDLAILGPAVFSREIGQDVWTQIPVPFTREHFAVLAEYRPSAAWTDAGNIYYRKGSHWRRSQFAKQCTSAGFGANHMPNHISIALEGRFGLTSFGEGRLLRSSDGGASWCEVAISHMLPPVRGIKTMTLLKTVMLSSKQAYILGYSGELIRSENLGSRWTSVDLGESVTDIAPGGEFLWCLTLSKLLRLR